MATSSELRSEYTHDKSDLAFVLNLTGGLLDKVEGNQQPHWAKTQLWVFTGGGLGLGCIDYSIPYSVFVNLSSTYGSGDSFRPFVAKVYSRSKRMKSTDGRVVPRTEITGIEPQTGPMSLGHAFEFVDVINKFESEDEDVDKGGDDKFTKVDSLIGNVA